MRITVVFAFVSWVILNATCFAASIDQHRSSERYQKFTTLFHKHGVDNIMDTFVNGMNSPKLLMSLSMPQMGIIATSVKRINTGFQITFTQDTEKAKVFMKNEFRNNNLDPRIVDRLGVLAVMRKFIPQNVDAIARRNCNSPDIIAIIDQMQEMLIWIEMDTGEVLFDLYIDKAACEYALRNET